MKSRIILSLAALMAAVTVRMADAAALTRENGAPVGDNQNSQTAGEAGPVLLQDSHLIEKLARFDRERVPERVVHARGAGAFGVFKSADAFSELTAAAPFQSKGKETPVFVRFSSVIHPAGSPESLRDPRGFATKFYTDQGNWDLVGNNFPVFFIRDAMKFPDMVHSLKPSPVTNKQEPSRFFDFFSHVPESTNMLTILYSDQGNPASYRQMDGNGVHAFKLVNAKGEVKYVKFHWKSLQGTRTLTAAEAAAMQSKDPGYLTTDLYENVGKGNFPSWELEAQVLAPEDLNKFDFNPLDATKEWVRIPGLKIVKLGTMTLNKMPTNFFETVEQSAFAPSNLIPGVEASEDRLLQGRLFSYADTQRYRIGANHLSLPVNRPRVPVANHGQAGDMNSGESSADVNYQPNSFAGDADRKEGVYSESPRYKASSLVLSGKTQQAMIAKTLNFRRPGRPTGPTRRSRKRT